jgi:hypothetical protein
MEDFRKSITVSRNMSLGILIVLALALIVGGATWYRAIHDDSWGKISFQEYTPSYLPDGLKVTSKTIDAQYTPANTPSHTTTLNLRLSKGAYVYEEKNANGFIHACLGTIVNQSCLVQTSPHNQRYALITTTIPGQPMEQTVRWLKGSTAMQITFHGQLSQPYSQDVLGRVVDSLQPVTYKNLKVNYYDKSRI